MNRINKLKVKELQKYVDEWVNDLCELINRYESGSHKTSELIK